MSDLSPRWRKIDHFNANPWRRYVFESAGALCPHGYAQILWITGSLGAPGRRGGKAGPGVRDCLLALPLEAMKKTGTAIASADDASAGHSEAAEIIDRAQLQADVARQRVRLAKDELHRARKRLKEAKREAKRARKYASLARKDWKRARRHSEKEGSAESRSDGVVARATRKPKTQAGTPPRSRRSATRSPARRTRRGPKTKAAR